MLFSKRDPLYPYERAILKAVIAGAPPAAAHILRAQVHQIRHVQRSPASPEVNFYAHRKGGGWSQTWLFANKDEVRLADIEARIGGGNHGGALFAVGGHVFALTLRPEIEHPKRAVLEDVEVRLKGVDQLLEGRGAKATEGVTPPSFIDGQPIRGDLDIGPWALLDPADVYLVSLPEADWAVLAQASPTLLLLGRRSETGESFCIANVEDDSIEPLTASSMDGALHEAAKLTA